MIAAEALIAKFQYALDNHWGYIWGTSGEIWTQKEQDWATREQTVKYGQKWVGHHVADCSGLFVWAFRQLGGSIYHGSNTIWKKYLSDKGTLKGKRRSDGQELKPGTAVFLTKGEDRHHIGLYIGSGRVIEARGTAYGVVETSVDRWDEWGELVAVAYESTERGDTMEATVIAESGSSVNMREKPSGSGKLVERIPVGAKVQVISQAGEWAAIVYNGKHGYMMAKFLDGLREEISLDKRVDDIEHRLTELERNIKALQEGGGNG